MKKHLPHSINKPTQLMENIQRSLVNEQQLSQHIHQLLDEGEASPLLAHFHPKNHLNQLHVKYKV